MEKIYRTYKDTQVEVLHTQIKCPSCGAEWLEEDMSTPGKHTPSNVMMSSMMVAELNLKCTSMQIEQKVVAIERYCAVTMYQFDI